MKEITDRLQAGLEELFNSEKYTEYLRVMSQFHHYSFNNTLLIAMQKPDATLVAGYHAWEKKFNRHVMKGEKGIQIIAPAPVKEKQEQEKVDPETGEVVLREDGQPETEEVTIVIPRFKVSTVFDLSQTDGDPLPELGPGELTASVENYEIFMNAIRSVAPVPMRFDEISSGAKGYYDNANKEIVIQSGMSELQTMKTAVHETAHAILHDRDIMQEQGIQKDQMTKEVEAESVAFVSLAHFELDTSDYSFPYIAGWSSGRDTKELKASLDTIRKTSSEIIDGIEASMREQILERQQNEPIQDNSVDIIVDGHEGTWRVIQSQEINGETFYLMESQEYGAAVADILLSKSRELVAEDLWNGIDYGAMEAVKEYFDQKEVSYSLTDFPLQERFSVYTELDPQEKPIFFVVDNVTGGPLLEAGEVKTYEDRRELMEQVKVMNQDKRAIYRRSATYAHERRESDEYRYSMQENRACKTAIEKMIRENFDGMHLDLNVVKPVIERFGAERVAYVLANTLQLEDWDGRYSKANKEWAAKFTYPEESGAFDVGRRSFFISSHPAVLDGFINLFRKELKERGLESDGRDGVEKLFIDHFYVVEDLEVHGRLAIKEYSNVDEALAAYFQLPNNKLKALGIQNTNPLPGSLDFIHCVNGIDTAIMDYSFVEVWNNPEVQEVQAQIENALSLHDTELAYKLPEGYITVESVENGYEYRFYDLNLDCTANGKIETAVEGEPATSLEGSVREIGNELRISFDDWRVIDHQEFADRISEAKKAHLKEASHENDAGESKELNELAVGYDAGFITVQKVDEGYDYTVFNLKCRPLDGGNLDNPEISIVDAMDEILKMEGLSRDVTWNASYETLMAEVGSADLNEPHIEPTLTFYASTAMDYPVMGEYQKANSFQEAAKLYEGLPDTQENGGKGIGFIIEGTDISHGMYALVKNEKVVSKMTALEEPMSEYPLVRQALLDATQYIQDRQTVEEIMQIPIEKETVPPRDAETQVSEHQGHNAVAANRKESVLQALRERQAKLKESEKQEPEMKNRNRTKGEKSL